MGVVELNFSSASKKGFHEMTPDSIGYGPWEQQQEGAFGDAVENLELELEARLGDTLTEACRDASSQAGYDGDVDLTQHALEELIRVCQRRLGKWPNEALVRVSTALTFVESAVAGHCAVLARYNHEYVGSIENISSVLRHLDDALFLVMANAGMQRRQRTDIAEFVSRYTDAEFRAAKESLSRVIREYCVTLDLVADGNDKDVERTQSVARHNIEHCVRVLRDRQLIKCLHDEELSDLLTEATQLLA